MNDPQSYIQKLFEVRQVKIAAVDTKLFQDFANKEMIKGAIQQILNTQKMIIDKWFLIKRADEIIRQSISIPNATVGKPYEAKLNFLQLGWNDIIHHELDDFQTIGLTYDHKTELLTGTPTSSGDLKLSLRFRLEGEPDNSVLHEKTITLIVNPNARLLWKNLPSNMEAPYWKEDIATAFANLGDKKLVAASKRGRAHANAGSFRDDDFSYQHYATGWNIVAVADGAGSATLSREGSKLACAAVVQYFTQHLTEETDKEFNMLLADLNADNTDQTVSKSVSQFVYQHLSKAAFFAYQKLSQQAQDIGAALKDFHTTLSFTLFKKFSNGYAFLSFGVGDSPMAVLDVNLSEVILLNALDVGTYGGGTRFITMSEIFQQESLINRIRFKWVPDFSYLILMTDGIYDPKFSVEAALDKPDNWRDLIADLKGSNEDGTAVDISYDNAEQPFQLAAWLDFWSPGNHDDRTLMIVF